MAETKDNITEDNIELKKFFFKIISFWYFIIVSIAISVAIAYYVNKSTVPQYRLNASVMLKSSTNSTLNLDDLMKGSGGINLSSQKPIEGEIALLKSYQLVEKSIQELDFEVAYYSSSRFKSLEIYHDCPFRVKKFGLSQLYDYPIHIKILNNKQFILKINNNFAKLILLFEIIFVVYF